MTVNLKRILKCLVTVALVCGMHSDIAIASSLNDLACPAHPWNVNTIRNFIFLSQGNDGTRMMWCAHRGLHDRASGDPLIPENSADAIQRGFDNAPCLEVDLGLGDNPNPALIHDRMTWRSTWEYREVNGLRFINDGLARTDESVPGHPVYFAGSAINGAGQYQNVPFSGVTGAWLRSNAADQFSFNELYPWVLLNQLWDYTRRCSSNVGVMELDVRDPETFAHVLTFFKGHATSDYEKSVNKHFIVKSKVWKLASPTHDYAELIPDFAALRTYGVQAIATILQGPYDNLMFESPEGMDEDPDQNPVQGHDYNQTIRNAQGITTRAKDLIFDIVKHGGGVEASMPYGTTTDALWTRTNIYLPDPCIADSVRPVRFAGWDGYISRYNHCRDAHTLFAPAIGGWIPVPEVDNGAFRAVNTKYPTDPMPPADPYWAANEAYATRIYSQPIRRGFMDYRTGLCCFVPSQSAMHETNKNYLRQTEDATVVVSDVSPAAYFDTRYSFDEGYFR